MPLFHQCQRVDAVVGAFRARVIAVWCAVVLFSTCLLQPQRILQTADPSSSASYPAAGRIATSPAWFALAQSTSTSADNVVNSNRCDGRARPRPGAIYSAVGHVNYGVGVELKADIDIPGGCEVNLPIEVPIRELGINSSLGLSVLEVTSPQGDGSYGVGTQITIDVRFSSTVFVEGSPTLKLQTGCQEENCGIPEAQSFVCRATRGEFAISFNGETIPNIDAGTSEEELKRIVQDFSGVNRIDVEYAWDGITRSPVNGATWTGRVCSDTGTTVTITFASVFLKGNDGDLPMLELDYMNSPIDPYTGMSWGDNHRLWYGWENEPAAEPEIGTKDLSFGGYHRDDIGKVVLGDDSLNGVKLGPAVEVTKGWKPADRLAVYVGGSGTDTLSFLYTVHEGDSSADLDYSEESSLALSDNSTITGENGVAANLVLPPLGQAPVYRLGTGAGLGANSNLVIDTSPPSIVTVRSPNEARAYGTGEVIVINVVFDQDVVLEGKPTLLLETGVFNQEAELVSSSNKTLLFQYVVQAGDSSSDLDYASTDALSLNGGTLHRASENASTEASITLPAPGGTGSLSQNEDIVVRSTTANVIDVDSSTSDGTYGAGEEIFINVTFGWWDDDVTPMLLIGDSAELWLRAGWRVRATVHGAINGSSQLVLEVKDGLTQSVGEGHALTDDDIGETVSVGFKELTLLNVTGNEAELSAPFIGDDVLEGVPQVNVSRLGYEPAGYYSGNGTAHLIFLYTVKPGDHAADLEYWDEQALKTGGYIRRMTDQGATAANVSLPEPGECLAFKGCSLGANRDIIVSTDVPLVENMTTTKPPGSDPYGVGEEIDVTVWFTQPVEVLANVTNAPRLRMNTGAFAEYAFGSGTEAITFLYIVQEDDITEALEAWDAPSNGELSALDVSYAGNTGYLRRASTSPTMDADLSLPSPGNSGSLSGVFSIVIDTTVPRVEFVNTTIADASYGVGQEVPVFVTFTAPVEVKGSAANQTLPYIVLNSGGTAFYQGGSGTSVLRFLYTVEAGDSSVDLDVALYATDVTSTVAVVIPRDGAIFDGTSSMSSSAMVTLPKAGEEGSLSAGANIIIDTTPPEVTNVTSSLAAGQYGPGEEVEILLEYNFPVTVFGVPLLWLDLGDADGYAKFEAMADGENATLLFTYVVQEGDSTADIDYTTPFALELNNTAGTTVNSTAILRSSTNPYQNVSLVLPTNGQPGSLGVNNNIWIETTAPSVESVSTTAADGVPRGVAARWQTVDVFSGTTTTSSGGFRLAYGDDASVVTSCIPGNASQLTADIMSSSFASGDFSLNVTVTEDDPPYNGARRFVVYFNEPELGVGALGLAEPDTDECPWFDCSDGEEGECDESGVTIDRDASVPVQEGAIEVVLHFTAAINVNSTFGSPTLSLRMDPTNTTSSSATGNSTVANDGLRSAVYFPGLTQSVDVGVDAPQPVRAGHFRLEYRGQVSGCMDVNSAESAAGAFSVKSRLEELEEIALLGIEEVTRIARGNGFRFSIRFRSGNPEAIAVPSANVTEGCLVDFDPLLDGGDISVPDTERLSFLYVLQAGDASDGLALAGQNALVLNGSTIKRASTNPVQDANLTVAVSSFGSDSGISWLLLRGNDGASVLVDCSETPMVEDVTSTAFGGTYGGGQRIYFQVKFSVDVIVDEDGSPQLLLETGTTDTPATFYAGNGTSVLTFRSTIIDGASTTSLGPYSRTALTRNNGFVRSATFHNFVDADLRLPERSENYSADGGAIVIETSAPQVTSLYTLKEDHVYGEGEEISIHVVYTDTMDVLGTPSINLNSGGEALFTMGGRKQIVTVIGDDDADFAFDAARVTAGSFRLQYGDEITDCISFNSSEDAAAELRRLGAFASGGVDNVVVSEWRGGYVFEIFFADGDGAYERYPSPVEVPWNYHEGCEAFVPEFAKPARAVHDTLNFLYQVGASDMAIELDIENDTQISVDDSSYIRRHQSSSVTNGNTTLPNEPLRHIGTNITINSTQPTVSGVYGVNGGGPFGYNDDLAIRVGFSLPVTSIAEDDRPALSLVIGSKSTALTVTYLTASAVYTTDVAGNASVNNDSSVYFNYVVGADDETLDLSYLNSTSLSGDLRRLSSNPLTSADLQLPTPGDNHSLSFNEDIEVSAVDQATFVHNVTRSPPSGTLGIGDEVVMTVHFSRQVRFTGEEPLLKLATTNPFDVVVCTYPSPGYYSDALTFLYVVSPGDATLDLSYSNSTGLVVPDTTEIMDESGTVANTTLPAVGSSLSVTGGEEWERAGALIVDTSNEVLYVASANGDGVYYAGDSIFLKVVYNNDVVVVGTPLLTLRVGDAPYYNRRAVYSTGSGTSTLVFEYVVQVGDHTINLDYDGTNALYLPTTEASAAVRSKYDETVDADPTLPAVWSPDTLGARAAIEIAGDTIPTITSVSATNTPNGTYGVGEAIDLEILFSTPVFVKDSYSLPYLLVEAGDERTGEAKAEYLSGNMTELLTFRYIVVEGDDTTAFDILDTRTNKRQKFSTAFVRPAAAEVKAASDRPVTDALLFMAVPGTDGTVSFDKTVALDTEAPYVRSVSVLTEDGVYSTGDELRLVCVFSQPVVLVGEDAGIPSIGLSLGGGTRDTRAIYSGGNGTNVFEFSYTVQYGDYTDLLDYESAESFLLFQTWQQAMERAGAAIQRASTKPSQDADLTLAPPGDPLTVLGKFSIVAMGDKVAVQTGNVRVVEATSSIPNGTYPEGSIIPVLVKFSVEVFVTYAVPTLMLNIGDATTTGNSAFWEGASAMHTANFTSGNGTAELLFAYTVEAGDSVDRLDYAAPAADALSAPFGSIVAAATLEPVYLRSLPDPGTQGSLGWNKNIVISDEVLLVEKVWTTMPDGIYGAGQTIDLYVGFRFPIAVDSSTAFLSINTQIGGYEVELSRQDTSANALVFTYTVERGDEAASLDVTSTSALNGTVRLNTTYAAVPINITLPSPGEPGSIGYGRSIVIDTTAPYTTEVTSTRSNGTYTVGATIDVSVGFSAPVVMVGYESCTANNAVGSNKNNSVFTSSSATTLSTSAMSDRAGCDGHPVLLMDSSGEIGDSNATYAEGNGSARLVFTYTVRDGDGSSRLDYTSTSALSALAGDVLRASTYPVTPADLTLPRKGTAGSLASSSELLVDSTAVFVVQVNSSKPNGVYSVGEEIYIDVYMSTAVVIEGSPFLRLNAGPNVFAVYSSGGSDGVMSFLYRVSSGDHSDDLDAEGDVSLVIPDDSTIQSEEDLRTPMILLVAKPGEEGSLGYFKDIEIDTSPPYVLNVASSKANAEYGAGEEIEVIVTFSYPVVILAGAVLLLDTGEGSTSPAAADYLSGNGTVSLTFMYTVVEGDESKDLGTYDGGDTGPGGGLVGTVIRDSDTPSQAADTLLPKSGADGSLTVNNDIVIDTDAPYVTAVLSLREGVYTMGELVDLQVVYSKPVNVSGIPLLAFVLDSSNDTSETSYAYYDASFDIGSFADEHRALSFVYTVRDKDQATHLKHAGSDALELHENATIKRASTRPTTDALINLPVSEGGSLLDLVAKAEVIVRGFYHAEAADLDITLLHQEHSCNLVAPSAVVGGSVGVQFGLPDDRRYMEGFGPNPAIATGASSRPSFRHRGIGYDYAFADVVGENVAEHEQAISRQSSTMFGGVSAGAVDGKSSRFFSDGSTTMTALETQPWWQVTLPGLYTLGYIRVFGQEEETIKREIQIITVRSKTSLGGSFTLNVTDAEGRSKTTGDICYNAVGAVADELGNSTGRGSGESLEFKLEELPNIDAVEVTRSTSSFESPYQRTWTITFLSPAGDLPQVQLASDEGLTSYGNAFTFATTQDGASAGGIYWEGVSHNINAVHGPSWVMVFDSVEAAESCTSLDESKANASYFVYVPDNSPEVNIPIPNGVYGQVVRVQLEGTGYLSISEVQLYELPFLPLSKSSRSNPVPAREEWDPIQAEQSLTAAFQGTTLSGQWVLRLRDTTAMEPNDGISKAAVRDAHGDGGVAGWELVVTDSFGNVFRYKTDSTVTIETLPKYGRLFVASSAAEAATGNSTELTNADGYDRFTGPCYSLGGGDRGDVSRRCPDTFGTGPSLSTRTLGAVAARNRLQMATGGGGGARVWYDPEEDYVGPDDFGFSVTVGGVKSAEAWVAAVHIRRCRLFEEGAAHELCKCESPVIHVDEEKQSLCHAAVEAVCADPWPGLGGNKTDNNSKLNSRIKIRMCKACDVTLQGQLSSSPASFAEYTSECLAELGKVGDWLMTEGYCQETYSFPLCENEASDPVAFVEGPKVGIPRALRLETLGSRQTEATDYRPSSDGECRCTQGPEACACRDNVWADRPGS